MWQTIHTMSCGRRSTLCDVADDPHYVMWQTIHTMSCGLGKASPHSRDVEMISSTMLMAGKHHLQDGGWWLGDAIPRSPCDVADDPHYVMWQMIHTMSCGRRPTLCHVADDPHYVMWQTTHTIM
ncbi:hypothetical protein ACOMHN_054063 [Nucella lapillus]